MDETKPVFHRSSSWQHQHDARNATLATSQECPVLQCSYWGADPCRRPTSWCSSSEFFRRRNATTAVRTRRVRWPSSTSYGVPRPGCSAASYGRPAVVRRPVLRRLRSSISTGRYSERLRLDAYAICSRVPSYVRSTNGTAGNLLNYTSRFCIWL